MTRKMVILILIDDQNRWHFFRRLAKAIIQMGHNVIFLAFRPSVYLLAQFSRQKVYFVPKMTPNCNITLSEVSDVLSGKLNSSNAEALYTACHKTVGKIDSKHNIDMVFIWNGSNTAELAVSNYANAKNISCGFFEIANLPGKIFLDPKGVNAKSLLADNPDILDKFFYDDIAEYNLWRERYLRNKFTSATVPQAKYIKRINLWGLFDRILSLFISNKYEDIPILKKSINKLSAYSTVFNYDKVEFYNEPYIFFPMQVSSDSQVLINSDLTMEEAIIYAAEEAHRTGHKLVIKPHPAEPNMKFIHNILKLKKKYGFLFSDENIFLLMKHAEKVITINSTAGLEALILNKKLTVLGRAFYKHFNQERLRKYIINYLINVDYFNDRQIIPMETINIIFRRIKGQFE